MYRGSSVVKHDLHALASASLCFLISFILLANECGFYCKILVIQVLNVNATDLIGSALRFELKS